MSFCSNMHSHYKSVQLPVLLTQTSQFLKVDIWKDTLITPRWQENPPCALLDIISMASAPRVEVREVVCLPLGAARAWRPNQWLIKPQVAFSLADSTYRYSGCCAIQLGSLEMSAGAIRALWPGSSLPLDQQFALLINRPIGHNIVLLKQGCQAYMMKHISDKGYCWLWLIAVSSL